MSNKRLFLYLALAMHLIIWGNSLIPGEISSVQSGWVVQFFSDFLGWFMISIEPDVLSLMIRKSAHFMQFALLGLFWMAYLYQVVDLLKKALLLSISIGFITAIIDEGIQIFVPGRAAMITDVLIDWAGVLTGVILVFVIIKKKASIQG